tara:strand:- start:54 stop:9431 length:9378 start_codon:yes stop_codon:yes gene_type:complete
MTDEEFLISLPQDLPRDEKIRRLEEWRKENPQPKKEEQPEEVEDKSDLPIGAAGPAGEPPKKEEPKEKEVEVDETENVEESPGADATKEKVEKPSYDMNSASYNAFMRKEKAKEIQDQVKNQDASKVQGEYVTPNGQKLGEVITDGSGWEYKMEANPDNPAQPLFYTRKVGDTNWTNASNHGNKEGDALARSQIAEASIANLFGLSEFDESKRQQYFQAEQAAKKANLEELRKNREKYKKRQEQGYTGLIKGEDMNFSTFGDEEGDGFTLENISKDLSQVKVGELIAKGAGDFVGNWFVDKALKYNPYSLAAAALDYTGVIDAEDYNLKDTESLLGVSMEGWIGNVINDYIGFDEDSEALYNEDGSYDFSEEVSDKIESGVLNIGMSLMAAPKWLQDHLSVAEKAVEGTIFEGMPTQGFGAALSPAFIGPLKMLGEQVEIPEQLKSILPEKYRDKVNSVADVMNFVSGSSILLDDEVAVMGQAGYEHYKKQIDVLNSGIAQFDGFATDEFGNAIDFLEQGDTDKALAAFVTGSSRITADALGSLPSVAQSMIPYVGIASIVIGEAAKANMESDLEGRELNFQRLFHSNVIGASEGLLELVTKKIGGKMWGSLTGKGLTKPAINKTLTQWGVSIMKDFGAEGLSESGTLLINSLADQIYKGDDRNNDGVIDASERSRKGMFGSKYLPEFGELMDTFLIGGVMGGGMSTVTAGSSIVRNTIDYKNIQSNLIKTGVSNLSNLFNTPNPLGDFDKNSTLPKREDEVIPEDITQKQAIEYLRTKNKIKPQEGQLAPSSFKQTYTEQEISDAKTELANKKNNETAESRQADSVIEIATNPATERFLETDLKRKVKSGKMSTTKADEIRSNFRSQQAAALQVKSQGITGVNAVEAMTLLQEKQAIQENIKKTDDAFNAQDKQRLDEINNRLGEIKVEALTDSTAEAIMKGDERGQAIAEQMGIGYTAGDQSTVDNKIKELQDKGGDIDTKNSTEYGTFVTMPDGSKEIIINNDIAMEDRVVTTAQHEVLHGVLKTTFDNNPEVVIQMGKSLLAELKNNPGITLSQDFLDRIAQYEADLANGIIDEATFFEEVMTLTSEGLSDGTIQMNESALTKLGDIIRRALSAIGINVTFKSGNDVLNFIRDYNKSFEKGKLDRGQIKIAEKGIKKTKISKPTPGRKSSKAKSDLQGVSVIDNLIEENREIGNKILAAKNEKELKARKKKIQDLDTQNTADELRAKLKNAKGENKQDIELALQEKFKDFSQAVKDAELDINTGKTSQKKSKRRTISPAAEALMEIDNDILMQALESPSTKDKFSVAQAITEKNWGLISPSLNINNEAEMNAAKEVVIDQLLGQFQGSGQGKYGARKTGLLAGFNPQKDTQVSTYLVKTIKARKPEIDAAIKDISGVSGGELTLAKDETVDQDVKPKTTVKKRSPRSLKKYNDTFLGNLDAKDKVAADKIITDAIEADITENGIPKTYGKARAGKNLGEVLGKAFGLDARVFTDKSWNIKQGDKKGLSNLRQHLFANAQKDFSLLPDAYAGPSKVEGKSTFIPNNVLKALYKKGPDGKYKKDNSKTLKDYINLLGDIDGQIYRASEAQTLKGLADLSFRNIIVEQAATKLEGDDKQSLKAGAKFSRRRNFKKKAIDEAVVKERRNFEKGILEQSGNNLLTEEGLNQALNEAGQVQGVEGALKMLGFGPNALKTEDTQTQEIIGELIAEAEANDHITLPLIKSLQLANFGAKNFRAGNLISEKSSGGRGPNSQDKTAWKNSGIKESNPTVKYYKVALGNGEFTFVKGIRRNAVKYTRSIELKDGTIVKAGDLKYVLKDGTPVSKKTKGAKLVHRYDIPSLESMRKTVGDPEANFIAAGTGLFWSTENDPNYLRLKELAEKNSKNEINTELDNKIKLNKRVKITNGEPNPPGKLTKKEADNNNKEAVQAAYKQIVLATQNGMSLLMAARLVRHGYQSTNGIFKTGIPFIGKSNLIVKGEGRQTTEEHSPPVSTNAAAFITSLASEILSDFKNGEAMKTAEALKDNAFQILIDIATDNAMNKNGYKENILENTNVRQSLAGVQRIAEGANKLNPSPLQNIPLYDDNGKLTTETLADKTGIVPTKSSKRRFKNNPSALNYQNNLIIDNAIDPEALSTSDAKKRLNVSMPVQDAKNDNVIKNSKDLGPIIQDNNITAEEMKTVLVNSNKTKARAAEIDPKRKGISVFDFDDTLAKTKETVIVNLQNGTTIEISAAEFARSAAKLESDGAVFDFSNFNKVSEGTGEGPLAELARKRQEKFGSKDIFVLTARPQIAATSIKTFLDGIGLNIPLDNITGLSDGTAQAKVDWLLNKTAEGYNDFFFADDSFANVKAAQEVLDAIDVKSKVKQAKSSKRRNLDKDFNKIIEEVTGKESFKKYSDVRARLEGKKKDGGIFKRIGRQFTITPSADDFAGLTYAFRGKGEQGNRHAEWIEENLIRPYNRGEMALLSAKVSVANDFAALTSKFPSLKRSWKRPFTNPLLKTIGDTVYTKEQAVRVYLWNKQGMDIPGMSKRDIAELVKLVKEDAELNVFADELQLIQKMEQYPKPGKNWLGGGIKDDILNGLDGSFRSELMAEFNENVDLIFTPENLNKLEAVFGTKYVEALKDSIRRMKSGSNRPVITGSGAKVVNEMLDWLNASVANVMFLNVRSGLLQTLSTVNFINWGDNNMYAAAKAFASKEMWPTFLKLMNSDYLVNRRDGLKINVNEAELADAAKKGGIKGAFSFLMDKGFVVTRIMDSFAIALGGAPFFINRKKALLNRVNPKTGKLYTEQEAETKAFEDFYAIAEETQQSSNPSKISSQQASIAGRLLLSFQNVTMQFNRKAKKSILDLYNRRRKPGMTQRESDLSNISSVIYYVGVQNLVFNALQQALFALAFDDDEEDHNLTKQERYANVANGMVDSLLFGLGFGGAIISTIKNLGMKINEENKKDRPDYREIPDDVFDVSSVIDAKYRKLKTAARTFTFNRDEIKRRGWSMDNPAFLAYAQIVAAFTNAPIDRVLQKMNNLRQATDEQTRTWHRIALALGWNGWNFGLPYWGRQSTIDREAKEDEKIKENYEKQVKQVKAKGFTKKIPLSGPNHYKPEGELGVDYMQVERPNGAIQYYVKHTK